MPNTKHEITQSEIITSEVNILNKKIKNISKVVLFIEILNKMYTTGIFNQLIYFYISIHLMILNRNQNTNSNRST